jgi:uncharacterized GH25 family protein
LFQGKPLPDAKFELTLAGYGEKEKPFFEGRTDKDGLISVPAPKTPLGFYLAKAFFSKPFQDPEVCDLERFEATLSYVVE